MAKRTIQPPKKAKRSSDPNVAAHQMLREIADRSEVPKVTNADVSRVMAMLGRKGGKIGGKMRLVTMTQERRSEIAFKAAQARWGKDKPGKSKRPSSSPEA